LFVSHNMGVLRQLCSQCVMLIGGGVATQGATSGVIETYLRSGCGVRGGGIVIKEPIEDKPGQITELTLVGTSGQPTDHFSCDELITLKLRMNLKEAIRGMYCWVDFTRTDGTLVWMNDSFDAGVNPLDNLSPGDHTISILVPARTVGHGEYMLTIIVTGPMGGATPVDALENACIFRVEDLTTQRGNQRPGFVSARASWHVD
jgi:lipopolysaccharide transport system ATP-binding protein